VYEQAGVACEALPKVEPSRSRPFTLSFFVKVFVFPQYRRIVYIVSGLGVPEGYKSTHLLEQHNKGTVVTQVWHTFTCNRFFFSITFVLVSTKDFICRKLAEERPGVATTNQFL
jgi:hypothetical protein